MIRSPYMGDRIRMLELSQVSDKPIQIAAVEHISDIENIIIEIEQ